MKTTCRKIVGFWHYGVILTYLSVASAIAGICLSVAISPFWGVVCLLISGLCDAFDGAVAKSRKNRTEEEKMFGSHIDSLSDLISFGIAPVMIGFGLGMQEWYYIILFALFALCALVRLAYFDVTEELMIKAGQKRTSFEGLPVTNVAVAIPIFFLVATMFQESSPLAMELIMAGGYLLLAILFVVRFRMPKAGVRGLLIAIAIVGAIVVALSLIRTYVVEVPFVSPLAYRKA